MAHATIATLTKKQRAILDMSLFLSLSLPLDS